MHTHAQRQSIPQGKKMRLASLSPLKRGALFYFGFFGAVGMFLPFLNVYFQQELGFSGRQIGLLAIFAPLMTLLFAIPVASLADRRRWRIRILTIAIGGYGTMMLLNSLPQTFVLVALLWFITTVTMSPIIPLADSLIVRMSLRNKLNYGSMRLWGSFGFAMASAIGGVLWGIFGFGIMFVTVGILFLLLPVLAFNLDEDPTKARKEAGDVSFWDIRRDTGLMVLMGTAFFAGVSLSISIMFDGIYMTSLGGTKFMIGIMFSMTAFGELPMMYYRERLARVFSDSTTLLFAYGVLLVSYVGYVLAWQPWMIVLTAATKGMGFGLFLPSGIQFISKRVPEHWSSTVQSVFNASMFGVAPLLAGPLGGELFDRFGPKAIYLCASLSVAGAACILVIAIIRGTFTNDV